ncbi:43644_t:CDS:2 [Gigaspora margarita]|uniref:43644_t:CDS:1 n=1 Tax=Gigaspora margarita TaxID=4874 RepID=A0ABN7UZC5_GIGMA|nr:43644_t:CDS:2 [Gigaspora margarita]
MCNNKLEQLKAKRLAEAQQEQEKLNNPGKCQYCQTSIKKGQYCFSCLKKQIDEEFKKSQEKSSELNSMIESNEENNKILREELLKYLAQLEEKRKNKKIKDIEAEMRENEEEIKKIKRQIAENEQNKNNNPSDLTNPASHFSTPPVSSPLDNNSPLQPTSNNQSNLECYNCKKNFNYGDNTHYFPQKPNKKWCDKCDPEIKICLQATQQIFQNQEVNVDNLNISTENKEQLKILVKIKKGEQVDIDKLDTDEENKRELKELQKQITQGQTPGSPPINKSQQRSQNTSSYVVNCLSCGQEYETDSNKKPHSAC